MRRDPGAGLRIVVAQRLPNCLCDDDGDTVRRFGFAYAALPDHVGSDEECFLVEVDEDDEVWYAVSRRVRLLSRVGYRFLRNIQHNFGPESVVAMQRVVSLEMRPHDETR